MTVLNKTNNTVLQITSRYAAERDLFLRDGVLS